jgi:hypothetical protein
MSKKHEGSQSNQPAWLPPEASMKQAFDIFEDVLHHPSNPYAVEVVDHPLHGLTRTAYLHGDAATYALDTMLAHEIQVSLVENNNSHIGSNVVRIYGRIGDENNHDFQIWNLYSLFRDRVTESESYQLERSAPYILPSDIVDKDGLELGYEIEHEFTIVSIDDLNLVLRTADTLASRLI